MVTFANRAKVSTSTTGTGTITLGTAVDGYQPFTSAGVVNSDVVRYTIEDGDAWEIGSGTYSAGTLTRVLDESSTGSLLNLSGDAVVYVTAAGEDIVQPSDLATVATTGAYSDLSGLPTLGTAAATDATAYATAAQGSLANTAVQPADNISTLTNDAGYITSADGGNADLLDGQHGTYYLDYTNFTNTPTIPAAYTDADVDTHLNTGTAASGEVLSWNGSDYDWVTSGGGGATDINGLSDGWTNVTSVGLGTNALTQSGSSLNNTAVGYHSQEYNFTGDGNTSIGADSLNGPDFSSYSTAAGYRSLYWNNGNYNIGIGAEALYGSSISFLNGIHNIGIGYQTGYDLSTGGYNFLGGYRAGYDLTTGSNNVALGKGALDAATTGGRNIAIGPDAMGAGVITNATGDNIAIGYLAGYDLTSGLHNVMIGAQAASNITTSADGVYIGASAFKNPTSGPRNVVVGAYAVGNGTGSMDGSVVIGHEAAFSHSSSGFLTAVGKSALRANTTGRFNVAVGNSAGVATTTGQNSVFVGYQAGNSTTTGSNQIVIGQGSDASSATVSNEITLGNSSITNLRCQVTTITSLSDARDKTDIQPLNAGLEFVEALNPVSFNWNMRDGGKVGVADTGFIAQDLQAAQIETGVRIPDLVYDVNPDKLEAGYGKLIPVLVQAIKDLSEKVKDLEAKLEAK